MIDDATARALAPNAPEHAQEAALATIAALAPRARNHRARDALAQIAGVASLGVDVRGDAALLSRALADDDGTEQGSRADRALGVVDELWILGPFRDSGGGLRGHDGPELASAWFDPKAEYAWGSYEVAW